MIVDARGGAITLALALALTGCADNTGAIDDLGHNGYDRITCNDFKTLAMDLQYQTITPADRTERTRQLREESGKAGDPVVRQATAAYLDALDAGNSGRLRNAITALTRICRF